VGTAISAAVLIGAGSDGAAACRGIARYLGGRWSQAIGVEGGAAPPGQVGRAIDRLIGGLPLPPRSMQVVRGEDLRALDRKSDAASGSSAGGDPAGELTRCPAPEDDGPYARRLRGLLRALRIFALCNLGLFLLTALLVARGRSRPIHYLVPAAVLAAATLGSSVIYFAAQDWFWSFIDGSFAGIGYLVLVSVVAALLADIAWNRARVVRGVLRLLWWVPV